MARHVTIDAPLLDVLTATCALPVYYPPHRLDGRRCGDGGLLATTTRFWLGSLR